MEDTSVTGRAYDILRADLISCRLKPGARLNISALQTKLALSQASIREALSRLTAEGLVEIERHRGFRVAPVSMTGFRELTQACATLELPCIRSSILKGDLNWELNLISTYHRASRILELVVQGREEVGAYSHERQAFHEALMAACDNAWLLSAWRMLYAQNMRYRHMYMPLAKFELELNPLHETFVKSVLARDVETAAAIWSEHYLKVTDFIEAQIADEAARAAKPTAPPRARRPKTAPKAKPSARAAGPRAKAPAL
jgi:DNA-binding GntR family transcriptional regulator